MEKVGQFPGPDISIDRQVQKVLQAEDMTLYKKGRIREAQSFGIGAFAYYRRLLESVISRLLEEVAELVLASERLEQKESVPTHGSSSKPPGTRI